MDRKDCADQNFFEIRILFCDITPLGHRLAAALVITDVARTGGNKAGSPTGG